MSRVSTRTNLNGKKPNEPQPPVVQSLGRLTVPGWGVREQWGSQVILQVGADQQAHAFKGAATDALKKCASTFGIGLDLSGQEGMRELAVGPKDLLTDDQIVMEKFKQKLEEDKEKAEEELRAKEEDIQNYKSEESLQENTQEEAAGGETPSEPTQPQDSHETVSGGDAQPDSAPSATAEKTSDDSAKSERWSKEDIDAMRALKKRLGIAQNDNQSLNPWVQKFFNDPNANLHMIRPSNVKDFLHFMSQQ